MGRHFGRIVAWENPPTGKIWRAFFDDGHKVYLHEEDVAAIAAESKGVLPTVPLLVETSWLGRVKRWNFRQQARAAPVAVSSGLPEEAWPTLWMAPLWVLAAVGGADSSIDVAEMDAIFRHMAHADAASSQIGRAVFAELASDFDRCQADFLADPRGAEDGLRNVGEILGTSDPDDALNFRIQLIQLARDIAAAHGDVSIDEKAAAMRVAVLIGLVIDES